MRPIGIASILREQTPASDRSFRYLMAAAGENTGNLLFTNAVWEQIPGPKERIGFSFDPEKINANMQAVVFPAANWFGAHVDLADFADRVERLDVPVFLIGLGAQDHDYTGKLDVPEGTLRFVRAVAERSKSISVRGAYTRDVLASFGIRNVTVTGCPSLYLDLQPNPEQALRDTLRSGSGPTLLHSTRFSARHRSFIDTPSIHRDIYRYAYRTRSDLLIQSEPEEISLLVEAAKKPEIDESLAGIMVDLYEAGSWHELQDFIRTHVHVFFDIPSWSNAVTGYGRTFGTRLHSTIMALNSGVPALLVHHDSRTREVSEFAAIPTLKANRAKLDDNAIRSKIARSNFEKYFRTRRRNNEIYQTFLAENGLL
jgi:hypothetical protein